MSKDQTYTPEWISEEDVAKWLGVKKDTLYRWRTTKQLAWTSIDGRTPMYDRKQINKILNEGSTYKMQGLKLETA